MQEKVAALESQCALLQKGKELAKVTAREKIVRITFVNRDGSPEITLLRTAML